MTVVRMAELQRCSDLDRISAPDPKSDPKHQGAARRRLPSSTGSGIVPNDASEWRRPAVRNTARHRWEDMVTMTVDRYWLTIQQVSQATGKSHDWVRRRLRAGGFPGAERRPSSSGPWRIPARDLLEGGLGISAAAVDRVVYGRTVQTSSASPTPASVRACDQDVRCAEPAGEIAALRSLVAAQASLIAVLQSAKTPGGAA
jgi:hypothetical protein